MKTQKTTDETPPFHLAMFAKNLKETANFYKEILGAQITHQDKEGWINLECFGHQLTFHEKPEMKQKEKNDFHWGFNLSLEGFKQIANKIKATDTCSFEMAPHWKDKETRMERIKMVIKDPNGHLIEIKHFSKQ